LIAPDRIRKPSFYDFAILHKLGEARIDNPADNILVTRRKDGSLVVAAWNLVDMDKLSQGAPITLHLSFRGIPPGATASIERVDEAHGNPMDSYRSMSSPRYPTQAQIKTLNDTSTLPPPERRKLANGTLDLTLPVNGLAVLEIAAR
jgi:xylan 1,4-beta-xylosidase